MDGTSQPGIDPGIGLPVDKEQAAKIAALRRHALVGQLMNLQPTINAGQAIGRRADTMEDQMMKSQMLRGEREYQEAREQRMAAAEETKWRAQLAAQERANQQLWDLERDKMLHPKPMVTVDQFGNPRVIYFDPQQQGAAGSGLGQPSAPTTQEPVTTRQEQVLPAQVPTKQEYGFVNTPQIMKPMGEAESRTFGFADRTAKNLGIMQDVLARGWRPGRADVFALETVPNMESDMAKTALGPATAWMADKDAKEFYAAANFVVEAIAHKLTGAGMGREEARKKAMTWLPGPGDDNRRIAIKLANIRDEAVNMATSMGALKQYFRVPDPLDLEANIIDLDAEDAARKEE